MGGRVRGRGQEGRREACGAAEGNRYKDVKWRVIACMDGQAPAVLVAWAGETAMVPPEPEPEAVAKDAACQSDYRESEVQTDPYTPDYVVAPGDDPELLTLATLKHLACS